MATRWAAGRQQKAPATGRLVPRTAAAGKVVKSVCPYCAVGCGQNVFVSGGKVTQIEGDPDSPVSRGRLCPKGSASLQLVTGHFARSTRSPASRCCRERRWRTGPARRDQVLYRRPFGTEWEPLDLDTAMEMIADRVIKARNQGWQWEQDGVRTRRTMG